MAETGYQQRFMPVPARSNGPQAPNGAEIIGRAISDSAENVGAMLRKRDAEAQRQADEAARLDRDHRLAAAQAAFATLGGEVASEAATDLDSGKPDHEARVGALLEQKTGDFIATLGGDQQLVDHFLPQVAALQARTKLAAQAGAAKQRALTMGQNVDSGVAVDANTLATTGSDAAGLKDKIAGWVSTIDAMDVPETAKVAMRQDATKRLTLGAANYVLNNNPEALLESIDGGAFNTVLDDKELPAFRAKVQAKVDSLESARATAAKAQLADAKEALRAQISDVNRFVAVDPQALLEGAASARAAGDITLAQDAEYAAGKAQVNAKYANRTPAEIRSAAREIEATANWRDDRKLVAAHDQLVSLADHADARVKDDPLGLYIEQGGAKGLPPLDLGNPATMAAYFRAGNAAASMYGTEPVYLPREVAGQIAEKFSQGGAGDKAEILLSAASYGRDRGAGLMRQIAPAKPGYVTLLDLATMRDKTRGQQLVREALNGMEQRRANPKLVAQGDVDREVAKRAGEFAMLPGPVRMGVQGVAVDLYAARAAQRGVSGFDRDLFDEALQDALGRSGETGGIGKAPNGRPMVLPRGMTSRDVTAILSRASGEQIMAAAFGGRDSPTWGGKGMTPSQFKRLTPVLLADDNGHAVYAFRSDSGYVKSQRDPSANFTIDLRALTRSMR